MDILPREKFRKDAQIRLFGCYGGTGDNSIAQQLASHLSVKVYAFEYGGGTLFTQDITLGHLKRAAKLTTGNSEMDLTVKSPPQKPIWLAPAIEWQDKMKFTEFS